MFYLGNFLRCFSWFILLGAEDDDDNDEQRETLK